MTAVQSIAESFADPHLRARGSVAEIDGAAQAAPAPRFSRTPGEVGGTRAAESVEAVLAGWSRG